MVSNIGFILLIVVALYLGYMQYLFGELYSVSESWLKLQERKPKKGWIFTLFCLVLAGIVIAVAAVVPEGVEGGGLFFGAGAGIMFTGVAANFTDKGAHTNIVHYAGSAIAIIGTLVGLGVVYGSWIPLIVTTAAIILFVVLYIKKKMKRPIYFGEVIALASIIMGLIFIK